MVGVNNEWKERAVERTNEQVLAFVDNRTKNAMDRSSVPSTAAASKRRKQGAKDNGQQINETLTFNECRKVSWVERGQVISVQRNTPQAETTNRDFTTLNVTPNCLSIFHDFTIGDWMHAKRTLPSLLCCDERIEIDRERMYGDRPHCIQRWLCSAYLVWVWFANDKERPKSIGKFDLNAYKFDAGRDEWSVFRTFGQGKAATWWCAFDESGRWKAIMRVQDRRRVCVKWV